VLLQRFYLLCTALCLPVLGLAAEGTQVVSTFTVPDDWVARLTHPKTHHFSLISSGGELHGYTLSAVDARRLAQAKVIVGINPQLEPWLAEWAQANPQTKTVLWLHPEPLTSGDHLWTVPAEVKRMVLRLKQGLQASGVDISEDNYSQLLKDISMVEKDLQEAFACLTPDAKVFVTQHPGLEGFAGAFGLKVAGSILESASAESADPSAKRYSELLKLIRTRGIKVITVDEGQNQAFAQRLAADAGLPPPISLGFEFLQKPGTPGDSWSTMMRLNGRKLAQALGQR
jgi:ABC-type Zn uptake system ZnuABC Zn-binding protein ZnuA